MRQHFSRKNLQWQINLIGTNDIHGSGKIVSGDCHRLLGSIRSGTPADTLICQKYGYTTAMQTHPPYLGTDSGTKKAFLPKTNEP